MKHELKWGASSLGSLAWENSRRQFSSLRLLRGFHPSEYAAKVDSPFRYPQLKDRLWKLNGKLKPPTK